MNTPTTSNPTAKPAAISASRLPLLIMAGEGLAVVVTVVVVLVMSYIQRSQPQSPAIVATTQPAAEVVIMADGFSPATISISKGQSVHWLNQDSSMHQVASDPYPTEDAIPDFKQTVALENSQSYTYTFNQTGTFTYHDHLNPYTIKGTVIVN
jgi:plastocyanin